MSGDKSKKTSSVSQSGSFTAESVKVVAESIGVSGLTDDALHYMADDVTYRLKFVVQVRKDGHWVCFNIHDTGFQPFW